jgi:hypothetical protein
MSQRDRRARMRNPFKRRQKLKGAAADWDESAHVDLGDYVGIPEDQMPAEWLERMRGVRVFEDEEGRYLVGVNITRARAEVATRVQMMPVDAMEALGETESTAMTKEAVSNSENWMHDDEEADPNDEIVFFEIDLGTAQLVYREGN